jgi:hypothetical protein
MTREYNHIKKLSVEELMVELKLNEPTAEEVHKELLRRQLSNKLHSKKYYQKHKEKIIAKREERKAKDPQTYLEKQCNYQKEKRASLHYPFTCECGKTILKVSEKKHLVSLKHNEIMKTKNEIVESVPI